jgi:CheY-like chemotaxis protein
MAAASGYEGLKLAQELQPDAIILDVMMPEMDGWEFLQRLRALPQLTETPVVICSVFNDPELAYSLGASANLPKPVGRRDVLEVLRQLGVV